MAAAGCLVALLAAESAQAQFYFRSGRFGVSVGSPGYWGSGYYGSPYWGSYYGRSPYWGTGYGWSPYGRSYYYGTPSFGWRAYSAPRYYGYSSNMPSFSQGYYSSPITYSSNTTLAGDYTAQPASAAYQSFYPGPAVDSDKAMLRVMLPNSNARLTIDGQATDQTGFERYFVSPSLQQGTYEYTLRATWTENGQEMNREKRVRFNPGEQVTVDLRSADTGTDRTPAAGRTEERKYDRDFDPATPERREDRRVNPPAPGTDRPVDKAPDKPAERKPDPAPERKPDPDKP